MVQRQRPLAAFWNTTIPLQTEIIFPGKASPQTAALHIPAPTLQHSKMGYFGLPYLAQTAALHAANWVLSRATPSDNRATAILPDRTTGSKDQSLDR